MFVRKGSTTYIQKVRVEVGTYLGLETDAEAFIEMKEIPTIQMMELREAYEKGDRALMEFFRDLMPSIIVDHNFYETEKEKMKPEAITEIVFGSLDLTRKVMDEYTQSSFFTRPRGKEEK